MQKLLHIYSKYAIDKSKKLAKNKIIRYFFDKLKIYIKKDD